MNINYPRTIWVVRHAEREDNINRKWKKLPEAINLKRDNSHLSERGKQQARELAERFEKINLHHIFASPFDRTIETASIIAHKREMPVKHTLPKEGYGDDACVPRLRTTIQRLVEKYDGDLLFVGHGASIGAILEVLTGDFKYVGQATVTKFTQIGPGTDQIRHDFFSCANHLSDKNNLRPW